MPRPRTAFRAGAALHGEGGAADVVTVTDDTNNAFNFMADATARHIWNSDGTLDEEDNLGTPVQINSGTDWIIPNGSAPGSYRIRHSAESGDTGGPWTPAGVINTFLALTSSRAYRVVDTTTGFGGQTVNYTIDIDDGVTIQDSSSALGMTLSADREDF